MKKLFFLLVFLPFILFPQNKTVSPNWVKARILDSLTVERTARMAVDDSLASDIAAIADSNFVTATELADSAFALSSEIPDTTYLSGRIDALPTVAEMETAIGDSVDLRIPKDITTLTEQSTPISNDLVVTYDLEADGVRKTALADLPASSQTVTLLNTKVNLNTANGSQPSYTARQQYIDSVFTDIYAKLTEWNPPVDPTTTPYSPTNFNVKVIAATTSKGGYHLTWNANGGDSVRIYRNGVYLDRVPIAQEYYITGGYDPHDSTNTFRLLAVSGGTTSNYDTSVANQISKFVTQNYYTSNTDLGSGTSSATAEHFAKFLKFNLGSLQPGDTVFIDGGASSQVYNNSVALYPGGSSRVGGFFIDNVDGTSANKIVFTRNTEAGYNGTPIFRYNAVASRQTMLVENSSYVEFSYLQFDTTNTSMHQLCIYSNSTNIDIKYNNFYHLISSGIRNEAPNTRVLYNNFYSDEDNTTTADAIYCQANGLVYNMEIGWNNIYQRNLNTASTQHTDGMQLNNIKGTTLIHDNFIIRYGGLDCYLSTGVYADNGAEGNLYVWNNIFVTTGGSAKFNPLSIRNEEATNPLHLYVYNNTFYGGSMDLGANSSGLSTLTWKNNLFWKIPGYNNPGFNMGDGASYEFGSHDMDYNRYYINTTYAVVGDAAYTWANWLTHIGGGETNSATVTTGFTVDNNTGTTAADWKLASGSEGIEDGTDLSSVYPFTTYGTADFFGTARTGAWNIGAYEGPGI